MFASNGHVTATTRSATASRYDVVYILILVCFLQRLYLLLDCAHHAFGAWRVALGVTETVLVADAGGQSQLMCGGCRTMLLYPQVGILRAQNILYLFLRVL